MPQAVINVHNHETEKVLARSSNGNQIAGLIFLLIVIGIVFWSSYNVVAWMKDTHRCLPLSQLVVTGRRHYTTNDDIRQSILALGPLGTFITQDVNVIQQQIERLPWIKMASVRKQWPDELKIYLVEYVPVAVWNDLYMLDSKGKTFSIPEEHIGSQLMPMLYGPEGHEQDVLVGYYVLNEILGTANFYLKAVSVSARHSWQLTLQDDIRLKLGRKDREQRLQRFIGIYPVLLQQAKNDNKRIEYIDLRYESGLAVGWAPMFIELEPSNIINKHRQNNNG